MVADGQYGLSGTAIDELDTKDFGRWKGSGDLNL